MLKCHFGATETDFLGRTNTPEGVKPQKERITNYLEKTKFPKSKKALQRYLGFLSYYRNYIPRLSEKLVPFFQLLKKEEKALVTADFVEQSNEINRDLDRCSQLALKQPLLNQQLVLMTDASFEQPVTPYWPQITKLGIHFCQKILCANRIWIKNFHSFSAQNVNIWKEFLAIYYAFKEFRHIFWGPPKPVIQWSSSRIIIRSQGSSRQN